MPNFLATPRKVVTVAWHKVCTSKLDGGIGLRSIRQINAAAMLKLCWDLLSEDSQWAIFLRARYFNNNTLVRNHLNSAIWPGIKGYVDVVKENMSWQLGDGSKINFWRDNWLSRTMAEAIHIPNEYHHLFHSKVSTFIKDYSWCIPEVLGTLSPSLVAKINNVTISVDAGQDCPVWAHSNDGKLSLKEAFSFLHPPPLGDPWCKRIWKPCIPPSRV